MKIFLVSASILLSAVTAAPAHATNFIGNQMKASWRLPTETSLFSFAMSPSNFTVGSGAEGEVQLTTINFLVDFGVNSLSFTFLTNAAFATYAFNGIYFEQLGGGDFGTIETATGIGAGRLHNMGSAFSVNFAGQRYAPGDRVTIRFVPDVPEPASWAMMIGGFALAGRALRARRAMRALC